MNKKILQLAVPNVVSNITIPLVGMVDLAILGHLDSEKYIGAIALGGLIFNFLYWGFGFLRMGTSGFTSQAWGSRNFTECSNTLMRALLVAVIAGLSLIILQKPIEFIAFYFLEGSSEVEGLATQYFRIRIFAAPATIGLYALTGWFVGMQNARSPLFIALLINILNLGLNYIFVYIFGLKSEGVAWGTLIAQYAGFISGLIILRKYYSKFLKYYSKKAILKLSLLKEFFKVNSDIFIRTLCLIFVFTFFTSESASMDDTILAVNTLLLQFLMIFSYLIDGFAFAAEALVGKFIGAKNQHSLKKTIKILFLWGTGLALVFSLIYFIAGNNILYLLTDNEKIITKSAPYMFWVVLIPILTFSSYLWDGIYIGATASKEMRNTMLASTFLLFVPFFFFGREFFGNHALWLALILFMTGRGFFQTLYAKKAIFGSSNLSIADASKK